MIFRRMGMEKKFINVSIDAYIWQCQSCNSNFSIIRYNDEDDWFHWGNPQAIPFCPRCGKKMEQLENGGQND